MQASDHTHTGMNTTHIMSNVYHTPIPRACTHTYMHTCTHVCTHMQASDHTWYGYYARYTYSIIWYQICMTSYYMIPYIAFYSW